MAVANVGQLARAIDGVNGALQQKFTACMMRRAVGDEKLKGSVSVTLLGSRADDLITSVALAVTPKEKPGDRFAGCAEAICAKIKIAPKAGVSAAGFIAESLRKGFLEKKVEDLLDLVSSDEVVLYCSGNKEFTQTDQDNGQFAAIDFATVMSEEKLAETVITMQEHLRAQQDKGSIEDFERLSLADLAQAYLNQTVSSYKRICRDAENKEDLINSLRTLYDSDFSVVVNRGSDNEKVVRIANYFFRSITRTFAEAGLLDRLEESTQVLFKAVIESDTGGGLKKASEAAQARISGEEKKE